MIGKGFASHDHGACIATGVAAAQAHCRDAGVRLTPVRKRVLEILLADHRALGAYEILDVLREEGLGSQPPVAYRALDFLVAQGLAHRIERRNAFVACAAAGTDHRPAFLICRDCARVTEMDADRIDAALRDAAGPTGFALESAMVEAEGLCPACRAAG